MGVPVHGFLSLWRRMHGRTTLPCHTTCFGRWNLGAVMGVTLRWNPSDPTMCCTVLSTMLTGTIPGASCPVTGDPGGKTRQEPHWPEMDIKKETVLLCSGVQALRLAGGAC